MSVIPTELQLRVKGVAEAVNGLNQVATASRRMSSGVDRGFGVGSRLGGGEKASRIMSVLGGEIGLGALGAGGLIGAGVMTGVSMWRKAVNSYAELMDQHNARLKDAGYKAQSYWEQILGIGVLKEDPGAMKEMVKRKRGEVTEILAGFAAEKAAKEGTETPDQYRNRLLKENPRAYAFDVAVQTDMYRREQEQKKEDEAWRKQQARQDRETSARIKAEDKYFADKAEDEKRRDAEDIRQRYEKNLAQYEQAKSMAMADFQRGPQYAGVTMAGSHEARLDAARTEWEKSFDLQQTANDYLREIRDKTQQVVIYGIN